MKIFDTITFFKENFITNLRFEILSDVVDYFIICESTFDHRGKKKKLNFELKNNKFKNRIFHLVLNEPFKNPNDPWKNQAEQREYIFNGIKLAKPEDYVMFSDPDEIPNPKILNKLILKKKYGIFLQNCFCYKLNLFNQFETPWEGTRICKMRDLKSINHMRQKIQTKNLSAPIWKIFRDRDIEIINDGGWHFNSLASPEDISLKLKTFAHKEFSSSNFSDLEVIKKNILERRDLFERNRIYKKIDLNEDFPRYILDNKDKLNDWII
tara:strand:- start:2941 stop:3741 length:801 start_codon:yes stop_codon:yes gene_type:complete